MVCQALFLLVEEFFGVIVLRGFFLHFLKGIFWVWKRFVCLRTFFVGFLKKCVEEGFSKRRDAFKEGVVFHFFKEKGAFFKQEVFFL